MQIVALHGFLGSTNDWVPCNIPNLLAVDLHHMSFPSPSKGFQVWAIAFNNYIRSLTQTPRILLGYSLGGRLALHAFIQEPTLWQSAIFISTHPGLKSAEEKALRLANDELWAEKFQNDPWDPLMHSWNSQPVFKNSVLPHRPESVYNRQKLAETLTGWSLAHQEDLAPSVQKISVPYIWAVGEHDIKFINSSPVKPYIISGCGHRIPYDKPEAINKIIQLL